MAIELEFEPGIGAIGWIDPGQWGDSRILRLAPSRFRERVEYVWVRPNLEFFLVIP